MQVACPHCGQYGPPRQYCDHCGTKLQNICPSCAAANRPEAHFCSNCGVIFETLGRKPPKPTSTTSAAQQKHVTVLFVDICGSTELISRMDAEDAGETLDAVIRVIRKAVVRFGGVVNREMGDGVMVLFGAPVATEDHAARACLAALAALDAVGRMPDSNLQIRAGVASGPVILRRTGRDEDDYDVAGVTVHIAARLEQRAEPGNVLLSEQTAGLVTGIAYLESVGRIALKGLAEPLPVYRLLSASDRPSWIVRSNARGLSTFVGREDELAQLSRALERASDGLAQAVAVVGDAGMGKSRLVHEFLERSVQNTWHVMRVQTTARTAAVPYFLITALLREFVGCSQEDTAAEIARRLPAAIGSLGPNLQFDTAALLIDLDGEEGAYFDKVEPAQRRAQLVQALRPILLSYADLHPLILVVEDYHWLDASSIELLDELFGGLSEARLLLLLTTRQERRPGWHRIEGPGDEQRSDNKIELELKRLTPAQADHLLRELIGTSEKLAPLRSHIIASADGTPLFLEEFVRSLHESGEVADGVSAFANIVIPPTVQSILAARIDRLPLLQRRILQIAAVIGRDVPSSLLADVSDMNEPALAREIIAVRAAGFLVEESLTKGTVYTFSHALTQFVAYDTLLRVDRRALHERVLRALETQDPDRRDSDIDQLTHHAIHAEAWSEAARYALMAGERAVRRSALIEAKAYLESAITALSRQPTSVGNLTLGVDARLRLRSVLQLMNNVSGMQECLKDAANLAELAGDRANLARVYISRGAMLSHWGDLSGAVELSRAALDIMLAEDDRVGIVSAAFALAQALWYAGDFDEARRILTANVEHARSEDGQKRSPATFVLPSVVYFCYLARVHGDLGDTAAGFAAVGEARNIADTHGQPFDRLLVSTNEGALMLLSGQVAASIDVLERALSDAHARKIEWHIPMIACLLGRAYVDTGRCDDARRLLEQARTLADRNRHVAKRLLCGPALVRALAGGSDSDLAAAKDVADATLREATALGLRPVVAQTHLALAHVLALTGESERAQAATETAIALSKPLGLLRDELEARDLLASMTKRGRWDNGPSAQFIA